MLILGQKSSFFGPTIFEITQSILLHPVYLIATGQDSQKFNELIKHL